MFKQDCVFGMRTCFPFKMRNGTCTCLNCTSSTHTAGITWCLMLFFLQCTLIQSMFSMRCCFESHSQERKSKALSWSSRGWGNKRFFETEGNFLHPVAVQKWEKLFGSLHHVMLSCPCVHLDLEPCTSVCLQIMWAWTAYLKGRIAGFNIRDNLRCTQCC